MNAGDCKKIFENCGTPTFIYSEVTLLDNVQRINNAIRAAGLEQRVEINTPYFTNSNPHLFRILSELGVGAIVQRFEEVEQLHKFGVTIPCMVAPAVLSDEDLTYFLDRGIPINVNLPEELELALLRTDNVGLRIDLTPQQQQRNGLKINEFDDALTICEKLGKRFTRIHTYPGTGSELKKLIEHVEQVVIAYKNHFPFVDQIDLGGGFSFDYGAYSTEQKHFPWKIYFAALRDLLSQYDIPDYVKIAIEPGRDLLADVGELVVTVNRVYSRKNDRIQRVHTNGSYTLMPSATIRARQHELIFLDKEFREDTDRSGYAELNGCTTLSNDLVFPGIVSAPTSVPKGYVIVKDIGAYGACQHLEFLNIRPAAEVLVRTDGNIEILTRRGDLTDRTRYVLEKPEMIRKQ